MSVSKWERMVGAADALRNECQGYREAMTQEAAESPEGQAALCISATLQACTDVLIHAMMAREDEG